MENIFSIVLKVFLILLVFSFYGYFFIKIVEVFNFQDSLSTDIIDIIVAILSLIATYYTVKFAKPFFDKLQQGK